MHSHCLGCFLCIAMIKTFFFGLFAILSTMACTHKSTSSSKVIHNQSRVCGKVTWVAGNQMPSPDRPPRVPKGIQREVLIYELTNLKQVRSFLAVATYYRDMFPCQSHVLGPLTDLIGTGLFA